MALTNTTNLELAFNDLIDELSKVSDLVSLAESYRERADIISSSLEKFLEISRLKQRDLEEVVFSENKDIEEIKNRLNILQGELNNQIEQFRNNVSNIVPKIKMSFDERLAPISTFLAEQEKKNGSERNKLHGKIDEGVRIVRDYGDSLKKQQSANQSELLNSINLVKSNTSTCKEQLYIFISDFRKVVLDSFNSTIKSIKGLDEHINEVLAYSKISREKLLQEICKLRSYIEETHRQFSQDIVQRCQQINSNIENTKSRLCNDLAVLSELVKKISSAVQNNQELLSYFKELLQGVGINVNKTQTSLKQEIGVKSSQIVDLLKKESIDINNLKDLLQQYRNSTIQEISLLKNNISLIKINQNKLENKVNSLEMSLLDSTVKITELIQKKHKIYMYFLISIVILISISLFSISLVIFSL